MGFIASSYAAGRLNDRFRHYWLRHPQLGEVVNNISFIGHEMERDYKNDTIALQSVYGLAGAEAKPPTFEEWKRENAKYYNMNFNWPNVWKYMRTYNPHNYSEEFFKNDPHEELEKAYKRYREDFSPGGILNREKRRKKYEEARKVVQEYEAHFERTRFKLAD